VAAHHEPAWPPHGLGTGARPTAIDSFKLVVIPPGSTNVFIPSLVAVSLLVPLPAFVVPCGER